MGIGIDLGGTAIKGGVVGSDGAITEFMTVPTNRESGYDKVVVKLEAMIRELSKKSGLPEVVGIGIPGIISGNGEMIISCPNLGWQNKTLKADLQERLNISIKLINDATAAAVGEFYFGSAKGKKNVVLLTLGTGVGGGIIINKQIITGAHGVASEIGHMIVGKNFYDCGCGKNGCLETFSSITALIEYVKMSIREGDNSSLKQTKEINGKLIFEAAQKHDALAVKAIDRMCYYLGIAISNLNDILDPELFVIGGGLSQAGDFLLDKIIAATENQLTYRGYAKPEIVLATLGNDAGIIGASKIKKND